MTEIRMTRSGLNIAGASRFRGDIVDVADEEADYLCSSGHAVRQGGDQVTVAVDDVHTTAERTTARPGRRRPRGPQ